MEKKIPASERLLDLLAAGKESPSTSLIPTPSEVRDRFKDKAQRAANQIIERAGKLMELAILDGKEQVFFIDQDLAIGTDMAKKALVERGWKLDVNVNATRQIKDGPGRVFTEIRASIAENHDDAA